MHAQEAARPSHAAPSFIPQPAQQLPMKARKHSMPSRKHNPQMLCVETCAGPDVKPNQRDSQARDCLGCRAWLLA